MNTEAKVTIYDIEKRDDYYMVGLTSSKRLPYPLIYVDKESLEHIIECTFSFSRKLIRVYNPNTKKYKFLHRMFTDAKPDQIVRFRNKDPKDLRLCNLEVVDKKTPKWVSPGSKGKYRVRIKGKLYGTNYPNTEIASMVADAIARRLYPSKPKSFFNNAEIYRLEDLVTPERYRSIVETFEKHNGKWEDDDEDEGPKEENPGDDWPLYYNRDVVLVHPKAVRTPMRKAVMCVDGKRLRVYAVRADRQHAKEIVTFDHLKAVVGFLRAKPLLVFDEKEEQFYVVYPRTDKDREVSMTSLGEEAKDSMLDLVLLRRICGIGPHAHPNSLKFILRDGDLIGLETRCNDFKPFNEEKCRRRLLELRDTLEYDEDETEIGSLIINAFEGTNEEFNDVQFYSTQISRNLSISIKDAIRDQERDEYKKAVKKSKVVTIGDSGIEVREAELEVMREMFPGILP